MNCNEFESRILTDLGNQSSGDEPAAAEKHLTTCVRCQTLVRQWQRLDAALTIKLKGPRLSADFDQRLRKRIQAETRGLSAAQRAERKRQLQLEFATGLTRLDHGRWLPAGWLAGLSYGLPAALAGWIAWRLLPQLVGFLAPALPNDVGQNVLLALTAGAVFLAIGLAAAFPQRVRNLWPAS